MVKLVFKSGAIVEIDVEIISIGRDAQGQTVSLEWKAKSHRIFKLEMEDVSCIIDDTPVMNGEKGYRRLALKRKRDRSV